MVDHKRPTATAIYDSRAACIGETTLNPLNELLQRLPPAPMDRPVIDANTVRYLLCLYVIGSVRSTREICNAFQLAWFEGQFLAASMLVRMLIELWGSVAYAEQEVLRKIDEGDSVVANGRMIKLVFGSKSGVRLVPGIPIEESPVNVMEFVRAADSASPGIEADYEFLCDAAHPSYLMNTFLLFAGATHNNWSNETFAAEMHKTLDRTLTIAKTALDGLMKSAGVVFTACIPAIAQDATFNPAPGKSSLG